MSAQGVTFKMPAEVAPRNVRYGVRADCRACRFSASEYETGYGWRLMCDRFAKPARSPCHCFEREPGADDYRGEK